MPTVLYRTKISDMTDTIDVLVNNSRNLAYVAAKSDVHGLTFATARELSSQGITINAIAPGIILDTDFFGGELSSDRINQTIAQVPAVVQVLLLFLCFSIMKKIQL
ncbi:MAG: family oxidoreductase [Anaerocolumna sp.]|jgi:NAD(P)-dependent dehydrogenase (short-subunit alcohol dehydrogenase family)|nr:family oxidoreductase [Anaerocolumna sp.]